MAVAAAVPAHADWRQDVGTLRIGMVSPSEGRGVPGMTQITTAFEYAAGIPAEILVARDYPALIRAMVEKRVDYAVFSSTAFAVADALCGCAEPVAAPLGVDGAIGVRAVIVARRGGVENLDQIAGARVVAGPADGIGPQSLAEVALGRLALPGPGGSILRADSYSAAEHAFMSGDADVLIGWEPAFDAEDADPRSGTLHRLADAGTDKAELTVVWSSEVVAYGPHVVRGDLPAELKERLGRFLVNLREQQPDVYEFLEPYRGGGFVRIGVEKYAGARLIADAATSR